MTTALLRSSADMPVAVTLEATSAALAATRATTFLRAQSQWLQRGLSHSSDRVAVEIVLGAHNRSHDRWVVLINQVHDHLGDDAATEIALLYSYLGRIAESLERRATELLCPQVAGDVRNLLAQRLGDRTEAVVEHLWQAAAAA